MKHILIDVALTADALRQLRDVPGLAVEVLAPSHESRPLPAEQLRGVHVFLCKLPPVNFDDLTSLELLQLATVGYEHMRHLDLAGRPFPVCNARGVFDTAIAEWNVVMMINLARDLRGSIRNQDAARWDKALRFTGEVRGTTLGLWGYGGIGRETTRLAKALGMTVHVLTRIPIGARGDNCCRPAPATPTARSPIDASPPAWSGSSYRGLDFLVLALPHTPHTDGMIGEDELRSLRRTAFVLNPARGPIIREEALVKALREKWIAGAALDTHHVEPLPAERLPLWKFPNVILTPHVSGSDRRGCSRGGGMGGLVRGKRPSQFPRR